MTKPISCIPILNQNYSFEDFDQKYSFEEFKLFYESTEKVTERRSSMNRWNYSICTAITIAIATIINWGLSKPSFILFSIGGTLILSIVAILFCNLWSAQIRDHKLLNNAKFEVLNKMAPHVCFSNSPGDSRISYCPFEKEWVILENQKAVKEIKTDSLIDKWINKLPPNVVVFKSSKNEYAMPAIFKLIFQIIFCFGLIFLYYNKVIY
jgi:hypothetical protein